MRLRKPDWIEELYIKEQFNRKDYYWENGLKVMTEHYHQKRGYCCSSGCRHCPYKISKEKF